MTVDERKLLVDEVLRWSTTTMHFRRTVTEDTTCAAQQLKKGDKVVLWYVSANFDEDQFDRPLHFQPRPLTQRPRRLRPSQRRTSAWARTSLGWSCACMFEEMAKAWSSVEPPAPPSASARTSSAGSKRLPVKVTWR